MATEATSTTPSYPLTTIFTPTANCYSVAPTFTWPSSLDPTLASVASIFTFTGSLLYFDSYGAPSCEPESTRNYPVMTYSPGLYCPMGYTVPGPIATSVFHNRSGVDAAETHVVCCPTGYSINEASVRSVEANGYSTASLGCTSSLSFSPGAFVGYTVRDSTSLERITSTVEPTGTGIARISDGSVVGTVTNRVPEVTFVPHGKLIQRAPVKLVYRASDVPQNPPKEMAAQLAKPVSKITPERLPGVSDINPSFWVKMMMIWVGGALLGVLVIGAAYWAGTRDFLGRRSTMNQGTKSHSSSQLLPVSASPSAEALSSSEAESSVPVEATSIAMNDVKQLHGSGKFSGWVVPWSSFAITAWFVLILVIMLLIFATHPEFEDAIIVYTGSVDSVLRTLQALGLLLRAATAVLAWTVVANLAWITMSSGMSMMEIASLLDVVAGKGYISALHAIFVHLGRKSIWLGSIIFAGLLGCFASDIVGFAVVASTGVGDTKTLTVKGSVPVAPGIRYFDTLSSDASNDLKARNVTEGDRISPVFISTQNYARMLRHPNGKTFAFLPIDTTSSDEYPSDYSGVAVVGDFTVSCRRIEFTGLMYSHEDTSLSGKFKTRDPILTNEVQNFSTIGYGDERIMMFAMDRWPAYSEEGHNGYPELQNHLVRPQEILIWTHGKIHDLPPQFSQNTTDDGTIFNGISSGIISTLSSQAQPFSFFGCEALFPENVGIVTTTSSGIPTTPDNPPLEGCNSRTADFGSHCPQLDVRTTYFTFTLLPNDAESTRAQLNVDNVNLASLVASTKEAFADIEDASSTARGSRDSFLYDKYRRGITFCYDCSDSVGLTKNLKIPFQRAASVLNPIMLSAAEKNETTAIADAVKVVLLHNYAAIYQKRMSSFEAAGPMAYTKSLPVSKIQRPWILFAVAGYAVLLVIVAAMVRIRMLAVAGVDRSESLLAVAAVVKGSPLDSLLENAEVEYPRNIHKALKRAEKERERERHVSKLNLGVRTDGRYGLGFVGETRRLRKRVYGYEVKQEERS